MVTLTALWLPILLAALVAFFISFVTHQVLPLHKGDHAKLGAEDGVREALRKSGASPGDYVFPHGTSKEMCTPEFLKQWEAGPNGILTILPSGPFRMGATLAKWFTYLVLVYIFVAYVASRTLPAGEGYLAVFRLVGTVAFVAHVGAEPVMSIWFGRKWSTSAKNMLDGLFYALMAAGLFGWLWPS